MKIFFFNNFYRNQDCAETLKNPTNIFREKTENESFVALSQSIKKKRLLRNTKISIKVTVRVLTVWFQFVIFHFFKKKTSSTNDLFSNKMKVSPPRCCAVGTDNEASSEYDTITLFSIADKICKIIFLLLIQRIIRMLFKFALLCGRNWWKRSHSSECKDFSFRFGVAI